MFTLLLLVFATIVASNPCEQHFHCCVSLEDTSTWTWSNDDFECPDGFSLANKGYVARQPNYMRVSGRKTGVLRDPPGRWEMVTPTLCIGNSGLKREFRIDRRVSNNDVVGDVTYVSALGGVYTARGYGDTSYVLQYRNNALEGHYIKAKCPSQPLLISTGLIGQLVIGFTGFNEYLEFDDTISVKECGIDYNANTRQFNVLPVPNRNCGTGYIIKNTDGSISYNVQPLIFSLDFISRVPAGATMKGVIVRWNTPLSLASQQGVASVPLNSNNWLPSHSETCGTDAKGWFATWKFGGEDSAFGDAFYNTITRKYTILSYGSRGEFVDYDSKNQRVEPGSDINLCSSFGASSTDIPLFTAGFTGFDYYLPFDTYTSIDECGIAYSSSRGTFSRSQSVASGICWFAFVAVSSRAIEGRIESAETLAQRVDGDIQIQLDPGSQVQGLVVRWTSSIPPDMGSGGVGFRIENNMVHVTAVEPNPTI